MANPKYLAVNGRNGVPGGQHYTVKHSFEVVQRARELREHKRWSLERIGRALGVGKLTVYNWVAYRTRISS